MCLSMECEHVRNSEETKGIPSAVLLQVKNQAMPRLCCNRRFLFWRLLWYLLVRVYFPQTNEPLWTKGLTDATPSKRPKGFKQVKVQYILLYLMQILNPSESYPFSFRFPATLYHLRWSGIHHEVDGQSLKWCKDEWSDVNMRDKKKLKMFQRKWAVKSQQSATFSLASGDVVGWRFTYSIDSIEEVFVSISKTRVSVLRAKQQSERTHDYVLSLTSKICVFYKTTAKSQAFKSSKLSMFIHFQLFQNLQNPMWVTTSLMRKRSRNDRPTTTWLSSEERLKSRACWLISLKGEANPKWSI